MKILFKNASILKMDDSPIFYGQLLVEDNKIIYIGENADSYAPFDRIIDCNGNVLMPGFKNAHAHSGMSFLRSKADDASLNDWLFKEVFPREKKLTADDIYHLCKLSFLEYLTSGITACMDQYYFPLSSGKAASEMGFRVVMQGTYNPTLYGGIETLEKWYKDLNKEESLTSFRLGFHAEYTASDEELKAMKQIIDDLGCGFQTHLAETEAEVENCIKNRMYRPGIYFNKLGLWDNGGVAYHCCYLSDEEIELFKKKNVAIVTCPGSNLKLASGIAPIRRYLDEGLAVAIGTDGPASNNSLDMFKEMMLVSNLSKISTKNVNSIDSYTILKMATVNGAKIMGLKNSDILEVGKCADLIELDMSRPSMQPINDVINNIVYSGSKDIVKLTMINGKILYEDGKFFVGEDVENIYEKVQEISTRIDEEIRHAD